MRQTASFTVEGVEPDDPAWRAAGEPLRREFWRAVVAITLKAKDAELAKGLDRYGKPLKPIAASTRKHRHSDMGPADPDAPPLMPSYGVSRTRLNLTGRAYATHGQFFWTDGWGKVLRIHAHGSRKRHLPKRDVIGLSPKSLRAVRRQALAWWESRKKAAVVLRPVPALPPGARLPVLGRSDFHNFTYGIASNGGDQAAVSAGLFAAGKSTGFFQKAPPGGFRPEPPLRGAGPPGPPRKPRPKPPAPPRPAPAPDPLAPLREWKPAGTVGGATRFMTEHLGVDRVELRVPGWVRDRYPDDAPLPEAELAAHLDAVNGEWARLRVGYPGLPERPVSTFFAIHSRRGFATIPDKNPPGAKNDLAAKAREWADRVWDGTAAWDKRSGNRSTSERRGTQVLDNFRHELGHALTTTAVRENFVKAAAAADAESLEWFRGHVSEYAATDVYEAIAEAFGVYTRADYPKGKGEAAGGLAPWLEAFFEGLLGR